MSESGQCSGDTDHDPEAAIDGLDPAFAVENRIDLLLHCIADTHTKWAYVRIDDVDVAELRQQAQHLEEYAAELRVAIEHYEDTETERSGGDSP